MSVTVIKSLDEFHAAINKERTAVVSFWATWAGACRLVEPAFDQFSTQHPRLAFFKVDIDAAKDVATEAGALSVPAFVAYKAGKRVGEVIGANMMALQGMLDSLE